MKIFTVMYFVEPIICLFAIRYFNMYVYSLFGNIILLETIYLLKFLRGCFWSIINSYPVSVTKVLINMPIFFCKMQCSHPRLRARKLLSNSKMTNGFSNIL